MGKLISRNIKRQNKSKKSHSNKVYRNDGCQEGKNFVIRGKQVYGDKKKIHWKEKDVFIFHKVKINENKTYIKWVITGWSYFLRWVHQSIKRNKNIKWWNKEPAKLAWKYAVASLGQHIAWGFPQLHCHMSQMSSGMCHDQALFLKLWVYLGKLVLTVHCFLSEVKAIILLLGTTFKVSHKITGMTLHWHQFDGWYLFNLFEKTEMLFS